MEKNIKPISQIAKEQVDIYGKDVNDACKDYASEKISLESKNETIRDGADVATFRIIGALKTAKGRIVEILSKKRMLSTEDINEVLDEYLQ